MTIEISGPPPPSPGPPARPDALEVYDVLPVEPEVWVIPLRRDRAGGAEIAEAPRILTEAEFLATLRDVWNDLEPMGMATPYTPGRVR